MDCKNHGRSSSDVARWFVDVTSYFIPYILLLFTTMQHGRVTERQEAAENWKGKMDQAFV